LVMGGEQFEQRRVCSRRSCASGAVPAGICSIDTLTSNSSRLGGVDAGECLVRSDRGVEVVERFDAECHFGAVGG
jgi:hypothetical protein